MQVISPLFGGSAKITQLCTLSGETLYPYHCVSCSNGLDNTDPYKNGGPYPVFTNTINRFNGQINNTITLDDAPQYGGIGFFSFSASFTDYVMCSPGGPKDIYVTLGKVTWATSFGAAYPSTNINPNSVTDCVGPDSSADFPVWTNVWSNSN